MMTYATLRQSVGALLHGAPQPAPRQAQPGELLMTFEHGQDVYRVELRDFQPHGGEGLIFQNGILLEGTRFTVRALAERWAERKRADSEKSCVVSEIIDFQIRSKRISWKEKVWQLVSRPSRQSCVTKYRRGF